MSYNLLIDDEHLDSAGIEQETVLSGTAGFLPLKNIAASPLNNGSNAGATANSSERPAYRNSNPERLINSNQSRFQDSECFY